MSTPPVPPLLLGTALLWWGWQSGRPVLALVLAVLVEAAPRSPWRWSAAPGDFHRLADFTNVLFVAAALVLFFRFGAHGVFALAGWLPVVLLPLILGQRLSVAGRMPLGALFMSLRGRAGDEAGKGELDVGFAYLAVVVVAALVTGSGPWVYAGTVALVAWGLWTVRPRRTPALLWLGLVLLAGGAGFGGFVGLTSAQTAVEARILAWFEQRLWDRSDPYRADTAIGRLGRLKLSERIVLHVRHHDPADGPLLLRQASYQTYRHGSWSAPPGGFDPLPRGPDPGAWSLAGEPGPQRVVISTVLRRGRGLLALPGDASGLRHIPAAELVANPWGAVIARDAPGFVSFAVRHGGGASRDAPPVAADRAVPELNRSTLTRIAAELELQGAAPAAAVSRLESFFESGFRYSLHSGAALGGGPALNRFLTTRREGHCEYFAAATVLLLRSAGIPARYATGYSVQEYVPLARAHVVRRRHAHAWALMWDGARWQDVDLTPAVWVEADAAGTPWWQPGYDLLAWGNLAFQRWRWSERAGLDRDTLLWLLAPLAGILAWRMRHRPALVRLARLARRRPASTAPAAGGPFARVYAPLARSLGERRPGETLQGWWQRVAPATGPGFPRDAMTAILALYYRQRFHPGGLAPDERGRMERLAREIEEQLPGSRPQGRDRHR